MPSTRSRREVDARRKRVGDVIKGRYKILSVIGKGGMSRVYLAADLQLTNKQWAVKEVDRNATDPTGRPIEQSLASEAELLSKLDHPNIVDIVDIEKTEDFIYVIMDHVEGTSLADVVRREGPQSEEDVQKWMLQVCDALGYLHRQDPPIVYRDMKPSNIMLHPDGYIKLIDLGVAREYKDEARKDTIAFGTTGYAAPEQYGIFQSDERADIFSLGRMQEMVLKIMDDCGLAPYFLHRFPHQFSGGQRQRIGIARALATKPKILLCDEATSALDPQSTQSILGLIRDIHDRLGITVIVITHQMSVVEQICTRVAILDGGEVAEEGKVSEVFAAPQSQAAKRLVYPEGYEQPVVKFDEGRMLRVVFNGAKATMNPLIARMAIDRGVTASIIAASTSRQYVAGSVSKTCRLFR